MTGPIVSRGRPLAELLPVFYRLRDQDPAGGAGVLTELLGLIDANIARVESDLATRYDDLFIETCSDEALAHFDSLLGVRQLPGQQERRALIGNVIRYRRGKGTIRTLEEVAGAAGGWSAHAVEYFRLLGTTQYLNHARPTNTTAAVRDPSPLQWAGSPFDPLAHTVDIRSVASGRGRYNIPDVGVHLWRLEAAPSQEASPAVAVDQVRYRFHPLGIDTAIYSCGAREDGPLEARVVEPLRLRQVRDALDVYYGPEATDSLCVFVDGTPVALTDTMVCDLGDVAGGWGHVPAPAGGWGPAGAQKPLAIDPTRGRFAFAADPGGAVTVSFCRARPMEIGSQDEADTSDDSGQTVERVRADGAHGASTTIEAALGLLPAAGGIVEIDDSGHYAPAAALAPGGSLTIRSTSGNWPLIDVGATSLAMPDKADLILCGLLVTGAALQISGSPATVHLQYCTLVPGQQVMPDSLPVAPEAPSLVLDLAANAGTAVYLDHCVGGPVRSASTDTTLTIADSILAGADGVGSARHESTLVSGSLATFPAPPAGAAAIRLQIGVNAELDLQLPTVPTTLAEAAVALQSTLAQLVTDPASAPSIDVAAITVVVHEDRLLITTPGTDAITAVDATPADNTATQLALTAGAGGRSVCGLLGDEIGDPPQLPGPPGAPTLPAGLSVEIGLPGLVVASHQITITTAPTSLVDAAGQLQDALRAVPDPDAIVTVVGDRLRVVPGTPNAAVRFSDGPVARALGLYAPTPVIAASSDGLLPAPALRADRVTVLGDVHVVSATVSDSIVTGTLITTRRQSGCLRYSYVGAGSQTPRRFHCRGGDTGDPPPSFVSRRFGVAGYGQQSTQCPPSIAQGAEDGSEMGAFGSVHQPQRLAALRSVLAEYLRFTAEGGIFLES